MTRTLEVRQRWQAAFATLAAAFFSASSERPRRTRVDQTTKPRSIVAFLDQTKEGNLLKPRPRRRQLKERKRSRVHWKSDEIHRGHEDEEIMLGGRGVGSEEDGDPIVEREHRRKRVTGLPIIQQTEDADYTRQEDDGPFVEKKRRRTHVIPVIQQAEDADFIRHEDDVPIVEKRHRNHVMPVIQQTEDTDELNDPQGIGPEANTDDEEEFAKQDSAEYRSREHFAAHKTREEQTEASHFDGDEGARVVLKKSIESSGRKDGRPWKEHGRHATERREKRIKVEREADRGGLKADDENKEERHEEEKMMKGIGGLDEVEEETRKLEVDEGTQRATQERGHDPKKIIQNIDEIERKLEAAEKRVAEAERQVQNMESKAKQVEKDNEDHMNSYGDKLGQQEARVKQALADVEARLRDAENDRDRLNRISTQELLNAHFLLDKLLATRRKGKDDDAIKFTASS